MPWYNWNIVESVIKHHNPNTAIWQCIHLFYFTVKPILRGHPWEKENMALSDRWPLKRGSIHMNFSMTGQEKCDLLIQVTA
jgi:hypothetical protein